MFSNVDRGMTNNLVRILFDFVEQILDSAGRHKDDEAVHRVAADLGIDVLTETDDQVKVEMLFVPKDSDDKTHVIP